MRSGRFVAVVGPDGSGKTTLARELLGRSAVPVAYVHWIPPIFAKLKAAPGDGTSIEKSLSDTSSIVSVVRLAVNLFRFWAGYLTSVRPVLRRGGLVVADRWGYGYVGQPRALKYSGPVTLARICVRLLPRPDLVVVLAGPPETFHARKPELGEAELRLEMERWSTLPIRSLVLDATQPVASLVAEVLDEIEMGQS